MSDWKCLNCNRLLDDQEVESIRDDPYGVHTTISITHCSYCGSSDLQDWDNGLCAAGLTDVRRELEAAKNVTISAKRERELERLIENCEQAEDYLEGL